MSVGIKVTIPKLSEIQSALKKSPQIMAKHIQVAIKKTILQISRESVIRAPHLTGRLEQSLQTGVEFRPLGGTVGSDLDYAVAQHENLDYHHTKGEAKFLEKGIDASEANIKSFFGEALNNANKEIASHV